MTPLAELLLLLISLVLGDPTPKVIDATREEDLSGSQRQVLDSGPHRGWFVSAQWDAGDSRKDHLIIVVTRP